MKVVTIIGTRPELIKLSRVIAALDAQVEHTLVHTSQNYDWELNGAFFQELGIRKPDFFLDAAGQSPTETIANILTRSDEVFDRIKPDALLILGDTDSCLCAIAAKRRHIPIFHMEAGNRCFDQRVPEEINRRIIDHISDINLVYSEHARRYLLAEGIRPQTVIKTGSPLTEVLEHHRDAIDASDALARLGLATDGYLLVSAHRAETIDDPVRLRRLTDSLCAVADRHGLPVVMSTHPRTASRLQSQPELGITGRDDIRMLKPFGFFDWIQLQRNAYCVLSDSGTLTEESTIVGFPAIMLRDTHERPEGSDEAAVIMAGLDADPITRAIAATRSAMGPDRRVCAMPEDYRATDVAAKMVRLILSHVGYVRRTVWFAES